MGDPIFHPRQPMKSIGKIDNLKKKKIIKKISEFQVGPPKLHNHEVMTDQ